MQALKTICKDLRRKSRASGDSRSTNSVSADIDKLLAPKTYEQLETLEAQVKRKLDSDEPIDYDYWEQLLRNLRIWKAKAKLRHVSQEIVKERLQALRKQQAEAAASVQAKLQEKLGGTLSTTVTYDASLDPEPSLKLRAEDKALVQVDEKRFLEDIVSPRQCICLSILKLAGQRTAKDTEAWLCSFTEPSLRPSDDPQQAGQ